MGVYIWGLKVVLHRLEGSGDWSVHIYVLCWFLSHMQVVDGLDDVV